MIPEILEPKLNLLSKEYVLVQAWKKTVSYIRAHNWYSDSLDLDRVSVNLPEFLTRLSERLSNPEEWENSLLRIVPAPKSQQWQIDPSSGMWGPTKYTKPEKKIRPLAHVSIEDQVAATALMLCLADRVETLQGDPRTSIENLNDRRKVISYGNRLFCDAQRGFLRHRWGATKLYRGYFQDYRAFLSRPEIVAEKYSEIDNSKIVIIHSDLKQFYDRVTPDLLANKIESLMEPNDDPGFFAFSQRLLNWGWNRKDEREVAEYARQGDLDGFSRIALPQGLVASGFFSNIVLKDFDRALVTAIDDERQFLPGVALIDTCRYVDDIRLVLKVNNGQSLSEIETLAAQKLQEILNHHASGMIPNGEKTQAAHFRGDVRPLVRQSRKMERIQQAISGGFDAGAGEEILDSIQGLVRSQARYSKERIEQQKWAFAPIADVRDETVARFAAARFRSTFRSLRPLLDARSDSPSPHDDEEGGEEKFLGEKKTQGELDDEARAFALGLIENWIEDPSNVRLLRIGLDLWPAKDVLEQVLSILAPFTTPSGKRKAPRRVAWYCLAEIFRAGATETGFVADSECLPDAINIDEYRQVLLNEARRLVDQNHQSLPWYLKQQILLFMAANNPKEAPVSRRGSNPETKHYRDLIRYLKGETAGLQDRDYASLAILARRSFSRINNPVQLASQSITSNRYKHIAERDPLFAVEILKAKQDFSAVVSPRILQELSLGGVAPAPDRLALSTLVLGNEEQKRGQLSNELSLLEFSILFLEKLNAGGSTEIILPSDVLIRFGDQGKYSNEIESVEILQNRSLPGGTLYSPPNWCIPGNKWRFQLGFLLRFILTGHQDFTKKVSNSHWKEGTVTYRAPESHWLQRLYGHHNGHSAFGADWLPITDWTEQFLYELLRWPGCRMLPAFQQVELGIDETLLLLRGRVSELRDKKGELSNLLMLPLSPGWPVTPTKDRPFHVCVVQSVIPTPKQIKDATDLTLSDPLLRRKHRRHLSAALEAVKSMLDLRETHKRGDNRLDFLILPELSVHPNDIETHLVPFARAYKTIILAGLTYEELFVGQPLINSALWLIPMRSDLGGLQILRRRQGKEHLAPSEKRRNNPDIKLQGFRPCQWLIGYKWDRAEARDPLWLTGSICFDATDIRLAADLRKRSDVFAVPAMNMDVSTFDQMAMALQYHMFQMVIVANNGTFGGSNAYAPYREPFKRQIFHLHGQPQASMAFLEIENIDEFIRRNNHALEAPTAIPCQNDPTKLCKSNPERGWKCPPAGICNGDSCPHVP